MPECRLTIALPTKKIWEDTMTNQTKLPDHQSLDRRKLIKGAAALAATAITMKAASAATVTPFGQTGATTLSTDPLPLGPLPGGRYPDSHLESLKKPKVSFGPSGFPAFAGTMAVERVATGFRWAEGPVYFPAGRYVLFSDIPNNRIMRFSEDDGHVSVFRQPSMNSNGNTIDREGRLITCEHSGRRVTRTELDGSITVIADKYNGKKLNSPNDAVVASDGSIWFTDPVYGIGGYYEGIKAEPEHYRWNARRPGRPHLVLRRLGRSERERRSLLFPDRRSNRQDPHTGDGGQFVLRRPAAKPNVHLRLDVALCSLHECPGRYEAMTSCEASTVT